MECEYVFRVLNAFIRGNDFCVGVKSYIDIFWVFSHQTEDKIKYSLNCI